MRVELLLISLCLLPTVSSFWSTWASETTTTTGRPTTRSETTSETTTTTTSPTTTSPTTTTSTTTSETTTTSTTTEIPDFNGAVYPAKCLAGQYANMDDLKDNDLYVAAQDYCATRCNIPDCHTWISVNSRTGGRPLCLENPDSSQLELLVGDFKYAQFLIATMETEPFQTGYQMFHYDVARKMTFNITSKLGCSTLNHEPGFLYNVNLTTTDGAHKLGYDYWFREQTANFEFLTDPMLVQFRIAYAQERISGDVGPILVQPGKCVRIKVFTMAANNSGIINAPIKLSGSYYCHGENKYGDVYEESELITNLLNEPDVSESQLYFHQVFDVTSDWSPPQLPTWHEQETFDC